MELITIKKFIPPIIFLGAPFLVFLYINLQNNFLFNLLFIALACGWIYLSVEDISKLSVPTIPLYVISFMTIILAILQQQTLLSYLLILFMLVIIFTLILIANIVTKKNLMGSADYIVIGSLAFTLIPNLIGPWLLLSASLPLIGILFSQKKKSEKLPFIPYLTVSWMLISTINYH